MSCKLGITIIYVRDIKKMTEFYTQALGLTIIKEQTSDTFVALAAGGTWIALADVAGPWVSRKLNLLPAKRETPIASISIELSFGVEDVDATWREWQARGVQTLTAPQDFPFGRAFDAQDPEGHLLNIYKLRTG
jgi:predicted enzyme related to lactoylglutathione lyase